MNDHDDAPAHDALGPNDVVILLDGRKGVRCEKRRINRDNFTRSSLMGLEPAFVSESEEGAASF